MKIVHIVLNLDCGGLENLVIQLARNLQEKGIDNEIVCLADKGHLSFHAEEYGINVTELKKNDGFDISLIFKLAGILKEKKADLIHSHNFGPLIYGTLAARLVGKRCINTRHGRTSKKINSFIWNLNKFIVPVSKDTKKHLLKDNKIKSKKIKVIYNGIDLKKFSNIYDEQAINTLREKLVISRGSFIVGTVGRLSPEKDQITLIKAFKLLIKRDIDANLIIIGDGKMKEDIYEYINKHNLNKSVKVLGYRADVHKIINLFNVFILPSHREGLSLSMLEAMAAGKPVIATKVGGNNEVVVDGENGFLVPCGYPERITNAILRIREQKGIAAKMGKAARRLVEEKFNINKMAADYETLYKRTLKIK